MRATLLTALATAAILSGALIGNQANAFTPPSTLGVAPMPLVQHVVNICGLVGCAPVQTKKIRHFKNGSAVGQHI
jgi:hypothetical protein